MNIVVPIKQVPDTGLNLQIKESQVDESRLKWVISPYDEFALEAALKLKSDLQAQIAVITLGPERAKEALLTALALGADTAYHLLTDKRTQDSYYIAENLKTKIKEIPNVSLIFCGKLSTDANNFAVPQMLAQLLNFPFVSNVNKLQYKDKTFTLNRDCGSGIEEILQAQLPLLISADKGLNTPRYPSLPGIMKAKKKPLHTEKIELKENIKFKKASLPPEKKAPHIIEGSSEEKVTKLIKILKEKEKVL
ncbi:MAG: electron transfer flavoprotein subunit beta/FixA family protein [Bdellovibrionaceae bacterium]|nr:electron transfer flavoprotein subunit beta/FixA family protein [Pseudobdellovibrionaceae bacterium]